MDQPITVTGLRAVGLSPDGKNLILAIDVKYSHSERRYCVPIECLQDFIVDLRRLGTEQAANDHAAFALEAAE